MKRKLTKWALLSVITIAATFVTGGAPITTSIVETPAVASSKQTALLTGPCQLTGSVSSTVVPTGGGYLTVNWSWIWGPNCLMSYTSLPGKIIMSRQTPGACGSGQACSISQMSYVDALPSNVSGRTWTVRMFNGNNESVTITIIQNVFGDELNLPPQDFRNQDENPQRSPKFRFRTKTPGMGVRG